MAEYFESIYRFSLAAGNRSIIAVPVGIMANPLEVIWNLRVPVLGAWKLLPWNKGEAPKCAVNAAIYLTGG